MITPNHPGGGCPLILRTYHIVEPISEVAGEAIHIYLPHSASTIKPCWPAPRAGTFSMSAEGREWTQEELLAVRARVIPANVALNYR